MPLMPVVNLQSSVRLSLGLYSSAPLGITTLGIATGLRSFGMIVAGMLTFKLHRGLLNDTNAIAHNAQRAGTLKA
jgi:hypothetical protein